jgi:Reverse transcriptase (RNA-dependent DNA polymerase)
LNLNLQLQLLRPLYIRETNKNEICKIIGDLNRNAAAGCDQISAKFCERTTLFIAEKITQLVNNIIESAHFPLILKESKVAPIHKSGSKLEMNNYRPVSIQSSFCKIVDRVLLNRFNEYLEDHNIIDERQYGFTSFSSTLAATKNLTNFICEKIDEGFYVACLFST